MGNKADFWPGAKLMAANHVVKGGGTRRLALLFRVCQTIANAWFPMTLLIFVNPCILLSLYLLLYVIPAWCVAGHALFLQPIYLITPPDLSLFGIDHIQPDFTKSYLYSAFRPFLMLGMFLLIANLVGVGLPGFMSAAWTFNLSGFLQAGLMEGPGPLVLDFVIIGTVVGTLVHVIMTLVLIGQAWYDEENSKAITLVQDTKKTDAITELANNICDAAHSVDQDSSDSDDELVEITKKKLTALGVEPLGKKDAIIAFALAAVDLGAYAYKIWVFLRGGRYFLAFVIMVALSESFFVLILNGHLRRAPAAFRRTARDGVPTFDYLACCQWDDGLAGVPYLMTTIYGLPLAGIHTWLSTLSGIFFIFTGTRAMGKFIVDAVDSDMFDVNPPGNLEEDAENRGAEEYLKIVEEIEEDAENLEDRREG